MALASVQKGSLEADSAALPATGLGAAAAELVLDLLVVVPDVVGDGRQIGRAHV